MRTILGCVLAALLVAACGTTQNGGGDSAAGVCEIRQQSRELNATLRQADESGGDLNAVVRANATAIAALADEAARGASGQNTAAREASCRAIALRANGALLRSPDHAASAIDALTAQSLQGSRACTAINNHDAATNADCDLINMWLHTIDGYKAARELEAIDASRSQGASIDDSFWSRVASQVRIVQDTVNHWADAPPVQTPAMTNVVAAQRTRMVCAARAPLVSMRRADASGSTAWQRVYADAYPALMRDAAQALSQSDDQANVDELERVCRQLGGS